MAYSPFDEGRLLRNRRLGALAKLAGVTPAELALAWLLSQPGVAAIPKASDAAHVQDNFRALDLHLSNDLRTEIDRAFPPPARATPLQMI
jgi:aldehyde reductase